MRILSVEDVQTIIKRHGLGRCLDELIEQLANDFARWDDFNKMPRPAMHVPDGVIELMPVCDQEYYAFKYVNGHPKNPVRHKQTVMATGQLSSVADGEPLLYSEMTMLTALRTAATAALATRHMARPDAHNLAIIGTGAQSEFQAQALRRVRSVTDVWYFDTDRLAMQKFARNMADSGLALHAATSAREAVKHADIITVCTACKQHVDVIKNEWVMPGAHINALGGDCPGKTELELNLLMRGRVVVEYFDQSFIEGEIQRLPKQAAQKHVLAELHEIIMSQKTMRTSKTDVTIFDSVGIALEDYTVLRWIYDLSERYEAGQSHNLVPPLTDPKDLFGFVGTANRSSVQSKQEIA